MVEDVALPQYGLPYRSRSQREISCSMTVPGFRGATNGSESVFQAVTSPTTYSGINPYPIYTLCLHMRKTASAPSGHTLEQVEPNNKITRPGFNYVTCPNHFLLPAGAAGNLYGHFLTTTSLIASAKDLSTHRLLGFLYLAIQQVRCFNSKLLAVAQESGTKMAPW